MTSFFDRIGGEFSKFWHDNLKPWFETTLANVAHDEVAVLLPLAASAAGAVAADLATNSGNLKAFASTAGKILSDTAHAAEAQAIQAGGAALITAVATAIVAHQAAVPLGGAAPPPLPAALPAATAQDDQTHSTDAQGARAAT